MKSRRLLELVGQIDDRYILEAATTAKQPRRRPSWVKWGTMAACVAVLIGLCFGSLALVAEAKEYEVAVHFFNYYDMSTQGLTRGEIKAVYRDITTKSFTYSKTTQVIKSSITTDTVGGYEIMQENPTPEDVENLWNHKNFTGGFAGAAQEGIHYRHRSEYKEDADLGFEVLDTSYIEKYDGDTLLWSAAVPEFWIDRCLAVSDGVIAYGQTDTWSGTQSSHAWLAKVDALGNILWKQMLDNGFANESVAQILENPDGSYAVFSRGDCKYFCLSQYSPEGKRLHFSKTEIGNYGIHNAAAVADGYIVQLGSDEWARIAMVDPDGTISEAFFYNGEDACYCITDMIEFNGVIYLSAYAFPALVEEYQSAGGFYEIEGIVRYLSDNQLWDISSQELTPMVRDNYTAMLLVCDGADGTPQEFYCVKGSLGGELSISEKGELLWDVESITTTFYSPCTSSFTIGGTSYVYRYTFDDAGLLVSQEKTGEAVNYRR